MGKGRYDNSPALFAALVMGLAFSGATMAQPVAVSPATIQAKTAEKAGQTANDAPSSGTDLEIEPGQVELVPASIIFLSIEGAENQNCE